MLYNVLFLIINILLRALKAGSKSPLLVTIPGKTFPNAWSVSLLGALHELYVVSKQQLSWVNVFIVLLKE